MTDLVVVSLEAWDLIWRRNQHLVSALLRRDPGLRVLFVEPASDPVFAVSRRRTPRLGRGLRRGPELPGVEPGRLWLYEPTKALPRRVDPHADDRLSAAMLRAARRIGMAPGTSVGLRQPVLWVNDPAAARLVEITGWPALYDVTDDWVAADRTPAEHRRLLDDEALLLARCAEVVVCSEHLAATKGVIRAVTLITNGVDLARYRADAPRPVDLPAGPTAVYVGTVHPDRFDVDTVVATAERLRGRATVVLVGPVVDLTRAEHHALDGASVRQLGARPWDAVPAYLRHADVLLVPHLVNQFTDSLDPIKLYEYRAVERPVVSTPVAGFRDTTDPRVTVAPADAFPERVAEVLDAGLAGAGPGVGVGTDSETGPGTDGGAPSDVPTWEGQAALMAVVIERTAQRGATQN